MSNEWKMSSKEQPLPKSKPTVANLGIKIFYDSLVAQEVSCVQIEWTPPFKQSAEIENILDELM